MVDSDLSFYREIAQKFYPPFTPADGIGIDEIERAEQSLGFRLPKVLREFYLLAGNHEKINDSHNRLLWVEYVESEDNKLIFYQENQGVCEWAIDLSDIEKDDPPVWIGQSVAEQDALEWHPDAPNLSYFLLMMLCWQSISGGLDFTGLADNIEKSAVQKVKDNFELLDDGKYNTGFQVFINQGQIVCLSTSQNETNIYAGASNEQKFHEIEELLKIKWDYCYRDD